MNDRININWGALGLWILQLGGGAALSYFGPTPEMKTAGAGLLLTALGQVLKQPVNLPNGVGGLLEPPR